MSRNVVRIYLGSLVLCMYQTPTSSACSEACMYLYENDVKSVLSSVIY